MLGVFLKNDRLGSPRMTIILQGPPCSYGKCRYCPFAVEQSISIRKILSTNNEIIERAENLIRSSKIKPTRISIFNGGSFVELPFQTITRLSSLTKGLKVDVELIPSFMEWETVASIKNVLEPSTLFIRVGFEVFDEEIRRALGKEFPNEHLFRISSMKNKLEKRGVRVLGYALFGISTIPESKVIESVNMFNKLLHGTICIRYRRYSQTMPPESPVTDKLASFLEENCLLVDWTEDDEWMFRNYERTSVTQRASDSKTPIRAPGNVSRTTLTATTSVSKPNAAE